MKKGKKAKVTQETACKSAEYKKPACSKEENLKKLASTGKLKKFVENKKGNWDHQAWLILCSEIVEEGYDPIDFNQVGLILEEHKAKLLGL